MDFRQVVQHLTSNESRMDLLNASGSSERRSSVSSLKPPNASSSFSPDQINQPTTYSRLKPNKNKLNKATTQGIYDEQNNQPMLANQRLNTHHMNQHLIDQKVHVDPMNMIKTAKQEPSQTNQHLAEVHGFYHDQSNQHLAGQKFYPNYQTAANQGLDQNQINHLATDLKFNPNQLNMVIASNQGLSQDQTNQHLAATHGFHLNQPPRAAYLGFNEDQINQYLVEQEHYPDHINIPMATNQGIIQDHVNQHLESIHSFYHDQSNQHLDDQNDPNYQMAANQYIDHQINHLGLNQDLINQHLAAAHGFHQDHNNQQFTDEELYRNQLNMLMAANPGLDQHQINQFLIENSNRFYGWNPSSHFDQLNLYNQEWLPSLDKQLFSVDQMDLNPAMDQQQFNAVNPEWNASMDEMNRQNFNDHQLELKPTIDQQPINVYNQEWHHFNQNYHLNDHPVFIDQNDANDLQTSEILSPLMVSPQNRSTDRGKRKQLNTPQIDNKNHLEKGKKLKHPFEAQQNLNESNYIAHEEKRSTSSSTSMESSADHAGSSNTQKSKNLGENILEIVQLVWHIVDLSLIALDILPGAINGALELIAQSGSSTIVAEDIVAKMLDQHMKKMKPKSVVKRLEKKFLGDDQIKSIQLCGEMIGDIENQLKTVFGQSLFNMEAKPEAYLVKTKLLFFYRRLYRKLFGLLEAPYDGNGIEKFKIMPNKSEKEALLIWLYGAMKYLSMQFNSSLKKFTALDRAQLLQIFVKFDQIETCKERMNLAFFAVDVTVAPLIDAYLSSRSEQFEQISEQNIACLILFKPGLNWKQIFMLANQFSFENLNSRMAYATTFKHIYYTSMQQLMAKYAGKKELITIKNATIYAKVYDAILSDLFTPETEAIFHNFELDTLSWHLIKSFLAKCVEQLNELINYWDQVASNDKRTSWMSYYKKHCNRNQIVDIQKLTMKAGGTQSHSAGVKKRRTKREQSVKR